MVTHVGLRAWTQEVQEEESGGAYISSRPRAGLSHCDLNELSSSPTGGRKAATSVPGFQGRSMERVRAAAVNTKMGSQAGPANRWSRPQGEVSRG